MKDYLTGLVANVLLGALLVVIGLVLVWLAGLVFDFVTATESAVLKLLGWVVGVLVIGLPGVSLVLGGALHILKAPFWRVLGMSSPRIPE